MSTHEQATATLPDAPLYLECPMCRATIDAESIAGVCASCPLYHMTSGCRIDLIACPDCGYHSLPQEHPGAAPVTARVDGPRSAVGTADGPAPPPAAAACSGAMRLSDVPAGTKARLLGFSGIGDNHLGRLTAYGLLPGVNVEVLQRFPAIILAVYQAELALEMELAEGVWVLVSSPPAPRR